MNRTHLKIIHFYYKSWIKSNPNDIWIYRVHGFLEKFLATSENPKDTSLRSILDFYHENPSHILSEYIESIPIIVDHDHEENDYAYQMHDIILTDIEAIANIIPIQIDPFQQDNFLIRHREGFLLFKFDNDELFLEKKVRYDDTNKPLKSSSIRYKIENYSILEDILRMNFTFDEIDRSLFEMFYFNH